MHEGKNSYNFWKETKCFFGFLLGLLYKRSARRMAFRRVQALLFKSRPAPHVLWLSAVMLQNGCNLLSSGGDGTMSSPKAFGACLLFLGIMGMISIAARQSGLMACFGALGFMLRFYMAITYLIFNWRDQSWGSYAIGAMLCGWIFLRVSCDLAVKRPWRVLRFHHAVCRLLGYRAKPSPNDVAAKV